MLLVKTQLFLFTLILVETKIYITQTQDGMSIEFFDCIFIGSLPYCVRPPQPFYLFRDNNIRSCENDGRLHRFSNLSASQINRSTILHQWKSSLERVEQYLRYLRDPDQHDGYLCQCVHPQSFGKNCEYRLPVGSTLDQTLQWQIKMKSTYGISMQEYGSIICYNTYRCESGLLCLDWREICDGIQQCMFGDDEKNCDLLEMNECSENEYRCQNGMCIPDEHFLDGDLDCLDWSDEMSFKQDQQCPHKRVSRECDDRICPPNQWSCGDGQCIEDRLAFQKGPDKSECLNMRDQSFMCETHYRRAQWTMPNGRCYSSGSRQYEESSVVNRSDESYCQYLLKCSLSLGQEKGCPCWGGRNCTEYFNRECSLKIIQYPKGGFIAPYVFFFFNGTRPWNTRRYQDWIVINGTIKCRGYPTSIYRIFPFDFQWNLIRIIEELFCQQSTNLPRLETIVNDQYCYHSKNAMNVCNESKICLSSTRLKDGFLDCFNQMDESILINIEKICSDSPHRFRCSENRSTCLNVMTLGDKKDHCENRYDEQWMGNGRQISEMNCNEEKKDQCSLLQQYIQQSWRRNEEMNEISSQLGISFHFYCNTFWNLDSKEDENLFLCQNWWQCFDDQWQCKTGECIEKDWINDGEWDCFDASDEEQFFYQRIQLLQKRNFTFNSINQSRFGICNETHPFPCLFLLSSSSDQQYQCLKLNQLNDEIVDCAGGIDEQKTLLNCDQSSILGHHFKCFSTNTCISYLTHCSPSRCPNGKDDQHWCFRQQRSQNCTGTNDFICFDGQCKKRARCNRIFECLFGEDEYMCDYSSVSKITFVVHRKDKEDSMKTKHHLLGLLSFPIDANITQVEFDSNKTFSSSTNDSSNISPTLTDYVCNRALAISLSNGSIICFCPPQYYGWRCEYHNDRLIVDLHLDLSQSNSNLHTNHRIPLKFVILFLFENQTLMIDQFHHRPTFQLTTIIKKKKIIYFFYSRSSIFLQQRKERYDNQTNILTSHPYSVRIEMYQTKPNEKPLFKAVWIFPIKLDFLPVFRLSKILRFTLETNPCIADHPNEECHRLINDPSQHLFLCKSNFTGANCSVEDQLCLDGYCAPQSLCKPDYRGLLQRNSVPFCLCPSNRFGDQCEIEHDFCQFHSCLNGGICLPTPTPDRFDCSCPDQFYGSRCQWKKPSLSLSLQTNLTSSVIVIQYFTINFVSLDLVLLHQQVQRTFPSSIQYYSQDQLTSPEIVLAKIYSSDLENSWDLYLLSSQINVSSIVGRTSINEDNQCDNVHSNISAIQYHHICINNSDLICFHDNFYLCICNANHSRVECLNYDQTLDQCSYCLSGGRCLKGNPQQLNDFICFCPSCYSGRYCQFNSQSFTFILDQLFFTDLTSPGKQWRLSSIIVASLFSFLLAIPNNLFSFVTLRRKSCLQIGLGHYLLSISLLNQITLGFLTTRLIHFSLIITNPRSYSIIDDILCKFLNYFVICFTRTSYWFSSFVALERVYTVIFLNGQWFKQPHTARRLMALSSILIFFSAAYELIFVRLFVSSESDDRLTMCVLDFSSRRRTTWITIHQTVSILHSILPLFINIGSTITIISIVVKKKMNISMANKCKLFSSIYFSHFHISSVDRTTLTMTSATSKKKYGFSSEFLEIG